MEQKVKYRLLAIAAIFGTSFVSSPADAVQYKLTNLGVFGGYFEAHSVATAINDNGQVIGRSTAFDSPQSGGYAFIWENGEMTRLGEPPSSIGSLTTAINNLGDVVGQIQPGNNYTVLADSGPVLWNHSESGSFATYRNLVSFTRINSSGQIVGTLLDNSNTGSQAMLLEDGVVTNIGALMDSITDSYASAINEAGQVLCSGRNGMFIYDNGTITDLPTPHKFFPAGINDRGQICGTTYFGDDPNPKAALYYDGVITDLGTLGTSSEAFGINNAGQVVGDYGTGGSNTFHASLYSNGVTMDLNDLLEQPSSELFQSATDINNSGEIVGYGNGNPFFQQAMLLTPIPEPAGSGLIALITAAVFCRKRRDGISACVNRHSQGL